MKKIINILTVLIILSVNALAQSDPYPEDKYNELKTNILSGWNTWDNRSILTHVLLPEGLALVFGLEDTLTGKYQREFFTGNRIPGTDRVRTIAHTPDGSFTHLALHWGNLDIRVRTASEGNDFFAMITPDGWQKGNFHISAEMLYNKKGEVKFADNVISAELPEKTIKIYTSGKKRNSKIDKETLSFDPWQPVYISTQNLSNKEIKKKIDVAEHEWIEKCEAFGGLYSESGQVYSAVQNAVNWLVVYDPELDRAVTPVARTWAYGWGKGKPGGYVLFCWDNFFAAWMHAIESKELAYNEAIQMCNMIDELGFVPNYAGPGGLMSRDRSQPPVGGMCIKKIYERHPERWFLEYGKRTGA